MTTHDNPYTIPGLAGTNLLGLASDIQERLAEAEAERRENLNLPEQGAFIAGALWAAGLYREAILANMPPDGPQPDGTILYTGRPRNDGERQAIVDTWAWLQDTIRDYERQRGTSWGDVLEAHTDYKTACQNAGEVCFPIDHAMHLRRVPLGYPQDPPPPDYIPAETVKQITLGGQSYELGAMPSPDGGYWAAYIPEGGKGWYTDGEPTHTTPEAAIQAAARAAEVDRMARG